jgi:DNA-binding MurR/RpiR family transcriptional regulator
VSEPSSPSASGLSEQIRQRLSGLSPSERRVARALLAGPPTIGLESSVRLARHAGVSGPTVSRFIAQLGFANYGAFQRALHEEIAARVMSPVEVYRSHSASRKNSAGRKNGAGRKNSASRKDSAGPKNGAGFGNGAGPGDDLLASSGVTLAEAVTTTLRDLNPDEFRRATSLLADENRQTVTIGGWFSHVLADHLAAVLRQIRPRVRAIPPVPSERAAAVADLGKRDAVVIFDFRRYERDSLEFARAARAASARIVLLTDPWLSPVAEIADAVLPAQVSGPAPFESLTPTLAIVETLITAVTESLGEDGARRLERFGRLAEPWVRHRTSDDLNP